MMEDMNLKCTETAYPHDCVIVCIKGTSGERIGMVTAHRHRKETVDLEACHAMCTGVTSLARSQVDEVNEHILVSFALACTQARFLSMDEAFFVALQAMQCLCTQPHVM